VLVLVLLLLLLPLLLMRHTQRTFNRNEGDTCVLLRMLAATCDVSRS
jgi:hypothetical protein